MTPTVGLIASDVRWLAEKCREELVGRGAPELSVYAALAEALGSMLAEAVAGRGAAAEPYGAQTLRGPFLRELWGRPAGYDWAAAASIYYVVKKCGTPQTAQPADTQTRLSPNLTAALVWKHLPDSK
jgi:poly-gamma-glutamate capsule biosynthesis protein CapA/YwtB (metallophosphatase superfamily)